MIFPLKCHRTLGENPLVQVCAYLSWWVARRDCHGTHLQCTTPKMTPCRHPPAVSSIVCIQTCFNIHEGCKDNEQSPADIRMGEKKLINDGPRILKERNVVSNMIHLYCGKKHNSKFGVLCSDCQALEQYSHRRLDHCQYGESKPTCRKCETHCYRPETRDRIRDVMRFSGPRLLLRAPLDWVRHQLHDRD